MSFKQKIDKPLVGGIVALVLPVLGFLFFKELNYAHKPWDQLWRFMKASANNRNELVIFPLIPNLVLFYFSNYQWRWDKFTQGLVFVTVILGLGVVISLVA
ncbi:hypothetical protein [Lishizhenia sp.]|uniref:hypothetical protein n=1 Tax=Lishizhenia sp. TaxID=2497594 RepID=UPI00299D57A3|nr:hypothetical protein [Lishizhenia sp.]MDX1445096.1 hypothetical protein [Lishizhenia sp.]